MKEIEKIRIMNKMMGLEDEARLFAVKYSIWNTNNPSHIEEIVCEALDTLPALLPPDRYRNALRSSLGKLQHSDLREISNQARLALESDCFNDACLDECRKMGVKR